MAKLIFGDALQDMLAAGSHSLGRIAAPLYGPSGKTVLFEPKYDIPMAAENVKDLLEDFAPSEQTHMLGVRILRDAAEKLSASQGCGVGTMLVLTQALLSAGRRMIVSGADPISIRKGAKIAADAVVKALYNAAIPVCSRSDLACVLHTASQDAEVVHILTDALSRVGPEGIITIEDSQFADTAIESGGIRYEYGCASMHFANDPTDRFAAMENPYILLVDRKINDITELETVLTEVIEQDAALLIVAKDYAQEVIADLLTNVKQGVFQVVAAYAPGHGEFRRQNMQALALRCGGKLAEEMCGLRLSECGLEICGRAAQAEIGKAYTRIMGAESENPTELDAMRRRIQRQKEQEQDRYRREYHELTLAILAGDSVTIRVGGTTEVEMFARKRNLENALATVRCALRGGVVLGGGTAFLDAVSAVDALLPGLEPELQLGARCVWEALCAPAKLIAENVGENGAYVVEKIRECSRIGYGFDARTHQFCDMKEAGIVDPVDTLCSALQTATETACTMLTVAAAIVE